MLHINYRKNKKNLSSFAEPHHLSKPLNQGIRQGVFPTSQNLQDKQNEAKQMLMEIGDYDLSQKQLKSKQHLPLIDSWIDTVGKPLENISTRTAPITRKSSSAQPKFQRKSEVFDENHILKLKKALKKLESPEKKTPKKNQQLLEKISEKRSASTRVADLIQPVEIHGYWKNTGVVPRSTDCSNRYRSNRPSYLKPEKGEKVSLISSLSFKQTKITFRSNLQ